MTKQSHGKGWRTVREECDKTRGTTDHSTIKPGKFMLGRAGTPKKAGECTARCRLCDCLSSLRTLDYTADVFDSPPPPQLSKVLNSIIFILHKSHFCAWHRMRNFLRFWLTERRFSCKAPNLHRTEVRWNVLLTLSQGFNVRKPFVDMLQRKKYR